MRNVLCCAALAALACGVTAASADVDIGVAIRGEIAPGVYGRVDIGGRPRPALVYAQPVTIEPPPAQVVVAEPVYLHVPPEHARAWRLHCREYHACNRPVYFVRSAEYEPGYVRAKERGYVRHEARERALEHERHEEHERHLDHERHEEHRQDRDHHDDHDHGHDHDHGRH
ncbi:MAG: hypothetical protein ACREVV_14420 [Steroidobacteraceae bacterium]